MSKPVSSLADVQSLAARCIEMADPQLDADFEAKFGLAPADFAALPAQAQQAHLQSHADAAKGAKYAVGNWGHLFGSDRHETNCRIVIDVENGELVAAQEKDGLKFVDLRGERFRDLAESVIEVNEAHNGYLDYGLVLSNELPGWAGGLDNAVSTLQGNVQKPPRALEPKASAELAAQVLSKMDAYSRKPMIRHEGAGYVVGAVPKNRQPNQPIAVVDGDFGRAEFKAVHAEIEQMGLEFGAFIVVAKTATYSGHRILFSKFEDLGIERVVQPKDDSPSPGM